MAERKIKPTESEHKIAFGELAALIQRHADKMSAEEVLAIAANMVGKLVALQDQRITTPHRALEIVSVNLQAGNDEVVGAILKTRGGA